MVGLDLDGWATPRDEEWMKLTSGCSASSLGMMSEEERKLQRIEDIKELLS